MAKVEFTSAQSKLADLLITTPIHADVGFREHNPDGSFRISKETIETHPFAFTPNPERYFALKLHETKPDSPLSPYYVNLRNLPDSLLKPIAQALASLNFKEQPQYCTGIPKAAIPLVKAFTKESRIDFVDIFDKEEHSDGSRVITGKDKVVDPTGLAIDLSKKPSLLIVDDLITEAGTKFEAIKAAEQLGFRVSGVAVLFDREQGGVQQLEEKGYPVYTALSLSKALDYYHQSGAITNKEYSQTID